MLRTMILKITHGLWNRQIVRILSRAYEQRIIDSKQLHRLASAFDPTQNHQVYGDGLTGGFRSDRKS